MIEQLKLTNFKKHEELDVSFTQGLNVIRGNNENGKSSVMWAITYAFFGSRVLPMSLEETVTWGKPVSTLKVELVFSHAGKQFTIIRKKSGAELTGDGVVASGHAEVTAFVENLFGTSANVAQATMLAHQSGLQAGLDSSAMALIEKLSNMGIIDELVGKIQDQLPSGSTKSLEAQLEAIAQLEQPVLNISELDTELSRVSNLLDKNKSELDELKLAYLGMKDAFKSGQAKLAQNKTADALKASIQDQLQGIDLTVPEFEKPDTDGLKQQIENCRKLKEIKDAFTKFQSLPKFETVDAVAHAEATANATTQLKETLAKISSIKVEMATKKAMRITESACGLCGKDLSEVPEVVAKNSAIDSELQKLQSDLDSMQDRVQSLNLELENLNSYSSNARKFRGLFPIAFTELAEDTVPPTARWLGGDVPEGDAQTILAELMQKLKSAESEISQHQVRLSTVEANKKLQAGLYAKLDAIQLQELTGDELKAQESFDALSKAYEIAVDAVKTSEAEQKSVQSKIATEQAVYERDIAHWRNNQEQRESLRKLLDTHKFNNGVIYKLRDARPVIAGKLWALVLSGISHYFSKIRGVSSTVTRGDKGFLIDGKSVDAYSGSTKDALGLAIRLMLQKTFLPCADFMLLDEVAAACDDVREADMLAMLSNCGIDQAILVTHSDLADAIAVNLVTI